MMLMRLAFSIALLAGVMLPDSIANGNAPNVSVRVDRPVLNVPDGGMIIMGGVPPILIAPGR